MGCGGANKRRKKEECVSNTVKASLCGEVEKE